MIENGRNMWQKCVFQRAWEEHVEKWTKKIWICVKPIGKFTGSSCWKSMDVPSPYTWLENPLLWRCWGNHWRTSALEVVVIHPERQRSCKNGVVPWFTSKFCPTTSSFQQKTIENSHLSQSSWTERNHNQDPTQMAGECQERGEKPGFLLQETGKIIARSFSEPVSKSDDETLLCLAGLALFLFFPACTACELVT